MDRQADAPADNAGDSAELKEWDTPELIVEEISQLTRGGMLTFKSPGDDVWYQS